MTLEPLTAETLIALNDKWTREMGTLKRIEVVVVNDDGWWLTTSDLLRVIIRHDQVEYWMPAHAFTAMMKAIGTTVTRPANAREQAEAQLMGFPLFGAERLPTSFNGVPAELFAESGVLAPR